MRTPEDFEYSVFAMQAIKWDKNGSSYIDHDMLVRELKAWKDEIYWHGYRTARTEAYASIRATLKGCISGLVSQFKTEDEPSGKGER